MGMDQDRENGLGEWADDSRLARIEASLVRIEASVMRTDQVCDVLLEQAGPFLRGRARLAVLALLTGRRRL